MSACSKIGYEYSGNKPAGYRSSMCDPCETGQDCCKWVKFNGFDCDEKCCPHPTGAIMFAGGVDDDLIDGFLPYYYRDHPVTELTGYNTYKPSFIDLGFISIVDDEGTEYMSELPPAWETNDVWGHGINYRLSIHSPMVRRGSMCSGLYPGYWHSGNESELTPALTPKTTPLGPPFTTSWWTHTPSVRETQANTTTIRNTADPTNTDTNTAKIIGNDGTVFRTITSTPSGYTEGTGYAGHVTSTAAGQTDTSIIGQLQESFTPTPTNMYLDTTITTFWEGGATTENQLTSNMWVTYSSEDTSVADSPVLQPFVSGYSPLTSLATGSSGFVGLESLQFGVNNWQNSAAQRGLYEPLIGAKITPMVDNTIWGGGYIFCTDGTDFKRLGTGDTVVGDTIGTPFALLQLAHESAATGTWPYTYVPSRYDCWEAAIKTDTGDGTLVALTGECGRTEFDTSQSTVAGFDELRTEIVELKTSTFDLGRVNQMIWHPTLSHEGYLPTGCWTKGVTVGGAHCWNGCRGSSYSATSAEWFNEGISGWKNKAYSQKSYLECVNNWVKSKLGNDWRIARANEIIKDYRAPKAACRTIHTHEGGVGTSLKLNTGKFHSRQWDGTTWVGTGTLPLDHTAPVGGQANPLQHRRMWWFEDCGSCEALKPRLESDGQYAVTEVETISYQSLSGTSIWETYTHPGSLTTRTTPIGKTTSDTVYEWSSDGLYPTVTEYTTITGYSATVAPTSGYTPIFSWTLRTTNDYGTKGTSNPLGVTTQQTLKELQGTPVPAIGTNTIETNSFGVTGATPIIATTNQIDYELLTNLGNDFHVYSTHRSSEWCINKKGCEQDGNNILNFFGLSAGNKSCGSCNEEAYQKTEKTMCSGWDFWKAADGYQYQNLAEVFASVRNSPLGLGEEEQKVASLEAAQFLGELWDKFYHNWGLLHGGPSLYRPMGRGYVHANQQNVTLWLTNPEKFYGVTQSNYNLSRCCSSFNVKSTGDWNGESCINTLSGDYCYSGEEVTINLGTGTGDFDGLVAGPAYWNDVLQTGSTDDLVSGNSNSQYSLGFGLVYPTGNTGSAITGNTDSGDSRHLRHFTKTYDGDQGESGSATLVYVAKVYKGTTMPPGSGLVSCPGYTGDTSCYGGTATVDRDGETGQVQTHWGSGGETYIKNLLNPSGECDIGCKIRTGVKIGYESSTTGSDERVTYSGYGDVPEACSSKFLSGSFSGFVTHSPKSERGYVMIDDKLMPKSGTTIYEKLVGGTNIKTENNGVYYIDSDKYLKIDSNGKVIHTGDCPANIGEELSFIANGYSYGGIGAWQTSIYPCRYPNEATFSATVIYTGNGEEKVVTHGECGDLVVPSVGTVIRAKSVTNEVGINVVPPGDWYYGLACPGAPNIVGYYIKLNLGQEESDSSRIGTITETGKCDTVFPRTRIKLWRPNWSNVGTQPPGWPSSGTACAYEYKSPSSHSEYGSWDCLNYFYGYVTGFSGVDCGGWLTVDTPSVIGPDNKIYENEVGSTLLFGGVGHLGAGVDGYYLLDCGIVVKINGAGSFASETGMCPASLYGPENFIC